MKKIICSILALTAFAGQSAFAKVTQNGAQITVSGTLENVQDEYVTMMMTPQKDTISDSDVVTGDIMYSADGSYEFVQSLTAPSGNYRIRVASELGTEVFSEDFLYISISDITSVVSSINAATAPSEVGRILNNTTNGLTNAAVVTIDLSLLDGIKNPNNVYQYVIDNGDYSPDDTIALSRVFERACLIAKMSEANSGGEVRTLFENNSALLSNLITDAAVKKVYDDIVKDENKTDVFSHLIGVSVNNEEFVKTYNAGVVLTALNNSNSGRFGVQTTLTTCGVQAGFLQSTIDAYAALTESQKTNVDIAVYGKGFTGIPQAETALNLAITSATMPIVVTPVGGGGGSKVTTPSLNPVGTPAPAVSEDIAQSPFIDTDSVSWAEEAIVYLYDKGIITGYDDNRFGPNNSVKREEFVKMVVNAFGIYDASATADFHDVKADDWSYTYVASAKNADIINGIETDVFGSGTEISRQDMAVIVYRTLQKFNISLEKTHDTEFADENDIADYAKEAVETLAGAGIINGTDMGFLPNETATRAQAAKVIYGVYNLMNE